MNNKGVTLVEILAVIVIIGILSVMITPGIIALRNNVLNNSLESKKSQIINAAEDYGVEHINDIPSDGSCLYKNVNSLIMEGYIAEKNSYNTSSDSTKNNQMINPVTNKSMNSLLVCIKFNSDKPLERQVVAEIVEDGE